MTTHTIASLVTAAEADYSYWTAITDESNGLDVNNTIAFYARFFEGISNGLNAVHRYHHAEEFVGRFLDRKHVFSLREDEFPAIADELAIEMLVSGYSPVSQPNLDTVSEHLRAKLRKWYYLLDRMASADFKRSKQLIFDLIAYDLTLVFHPSNLDTALLSAYSRQFALEHDEFGTIESIGRALGLPERFRWYLWFKSAFPAGWDSVTDPKEVAKLAPQFAKVIETVRTRKSMRFDGVTPLTQHAKRLGSRYRQDLDRMPSYTEGLETIAASLGDLSFPFEAKDITDMARACVTALKKVDGHPSNTFDEQSVQMYIAEKLKRWRHLLTEENREIALPIALNDIIRVFHAGIMDDELVKAGRDYGALGDGMMVTIAGRSLKFSEKFIRFRLFLRGFPSWKDEFTVEGAPTLVPSFITALDYVKTVQKTVDTLPKNRYATMTKGFTSFHTIKKVIETYYDKKEALGSWETRVEDLYNAIVTKKQATDTNGQLDAIERSIERMPKKPDEDQFDEALYLLMERDIRTQKMSGLQDLLEDSNYREKYLKHAFYRFDAFTFNRIMATNYAGLGNLFGTKGFIILIEAFLIGSGLEHIIDHVVRGSVVTAINGASLINTAIFTTDALDSVPLMNDGLAEMMPSSLNFTWDAFGIGWANMDWGRTILSLAIPILFMLLITTYNYLFHKLGRKSHREKSFKRLASATKRWIDGIPHLVNLSKNKQYNVIFEWIKTAWLLAETVFIINLLHISGFQPTQLALFFFLLSTICLSAYQGNKLKDEVTLGQSETISDTVRDFVFLPIVELGKFLGGQAKSINFIPWLVKTGVEPLYKSVTGVMQSFIVFQRERKDDLI